MDKAKQAEWAVAVMKAGILACPHCGAGRQQQVAQEYDHEDLSVIVPYACDQCRGTYRVAFEPCSARVDVESEDSDWIEKEAV